MNANAAAVETHGLTKVYGSGNTEVVAMQNVTFSVRHGEVMALLGPSGAGKSTLLAAVGLINPPTSGKVIINGQLVMDNTRAMTDLTSFRRNHIGFVFQKSNLIPFLSAIENVQVALEINQWSASKARLRALELLTASTELRDRLEAAVLALEVGAGSGILQCERRVIRERFEESQVVRSKRFGQIVDGSDPRRLHGRFDAGIAGEHDDGGRGGARGQHGNHLQPGFTGQLQIDDRMAGRKGFRHDPGFNRVVCDRHLEAAFLHGAREGGSKIGVILDDQ